MSQLVYAGSEDSAKLDRSQLEQSKRVGPGLTTDNLRNLVERGAATHRLAPRDVWCWAFDAMLEGELDYEYAPDPCYNTPEIERDRWRGLFEGTRLVTAIGPTDPSRFGWTMNLSLVSDQFEKWLEKRSRGATAAPVRRGPKSRAAEMCEAYKALRAEGHDFPSKKAAHRAVLKRLGVGP